MPMPRPTPAPPREEGAPLRVAGYARTSSDGQRREETHEVQVAWLQEQARLHGWELTLYVEPGISGETIAGRPRFRELLAGVSAGRFDAVAVKALDRLGRSQGLSDWGTIAETCKRAGVRILAGGMTIDLRDPTQGFMFTMLGPGVAGFEKSMILARTSAGRLRALRAGRKPRGTDPLGLRHHRDEHRWEIVEEEAATVRRAFELAAAGHSTREVEERLRAEGRFGKKGRPISYGRVWSMLRSTTYLGEWKHSGGIVRVPPIVDRDLWERVQRALGAAKTYLKGDLHWLVGLCRCAACGLPAHAANVGRSRTPYLVCASAHPHYRAKGVERCGNSWRRDRVEQVVWEMARRVLEEPGYLERARPQKRADRVAELRAEVEAAERRLKDLDGKVGALTLRWSHGQLTDAAYDLATQVLAGERALADERLEDARRQLEELVSAQTASSEAGSVLEAYRARLAAATPEERRRVIRALCPRPGVHGVWLHPDGRVELRGIAPAFRGGAPSSPKGRAATSISFSVIGIAAKRAYRRRKPRE
jgi:site-specific DNA recombinase